MLEEQIQVLACSRPILPMLTKFDEDELIVGDTWAKQHTQCGFTELPLQE